MLREKAIDLSSEHWELEQQKPAKRTEGENQGSVVSLKIRWSEFLSLF